MLCILSTVDVHNAQHLDTANNITLVSYASSDIFSYAAYSIAVNAAYAVQHHYRFRVFNESTSNYEPLDQRWNRVKILLKEVEECLDMEKYFVWLDADLIFLDHSFSIQDIINENKGFDIILSAERHAATGVANTGCIIIKSSPWSLNFLQSWWNNFDRRLNHDQIFFDKLYKSLLPTVTEHIKIIESHVLNTHPPAVIYQEDHHQVLHLMGERNDVRSEIFRYAFETICSPLEILPHQLGLSRQILLTMTLRTYRSRFESLLEQLKSDVTLLQAIVEIREILLQTTKYISAAAIQWDETYTLFDRLLRQKGEMLNFRRILYGKMQFLLDSDSLISERVNLLNMHAMLGNDLAQDSPITERALVLEPVLSSLKELRGLVTTSGVILVDEMLSSAYHSIALAYIGSSDDAKKTMMYLEMSIATLKSHGSSGNPYHLIEPMKDLASFYCSIGLLEKSLNLYDELLSLLRSLLSAEQQLKENHLTLAQVLLLRYRCLIVVDDHSHLYSNDSAILQEALNILHIHPEVNSAREILRSFHEAEMLSITKKKKVYKKKK